MVYIFIFKKTHSAFVILVKFLVDNLFVALAKATGNIVAFCDLLLFVFAVVL